MTRPMGTSSALGPFGQRRRRAGLQRMIFSFRQGIIVPTATVFDGFSSMLALMYQGQVAGFAPIAS